MIGWQQVPTVAADTRLDHRWIDLRTPANQAIFKIQSAVCQYFRGNLASKVCPLLAVGNCLLLLLPLLDDRVVMVVVLVLVVLC